MTGYIVELKEMNSNRKIEIPYLRLLLAGPGTFGSPVGDAIMGVRIDLDGNELKFQGQKTQDQGNIGSIYPIGGELGLGYGHSLFLSLVEGAPARVTLTRKNEVEVQPGKSYGLGTSSGGEGTLQFISHEGAATLGYTLARVNLDDVDKMIDSPASSPFSPKIITLDPATVSSSSYSNDVVAGNGTYQGQRSVATIDAVTNILIQGLEKAITLQLKGSDGTVEPYRIKKPEIRRVTKGLDVSSHVHLPGEKVHVYKDAGQIIGLGMGLEATLPK